MPFARTAKEAQVVFAVKGVAQCATPFSAAKVYHGMTVLSRNTDDKIAVQKPLPKRLCIDW
jgi:hypothetical protein